MATRFTYRLISSDGGYIAKCEELPVESFGRLPGEAIDALKRAVELRLASVEAVGPPSRPPPFPIIELAAAVEPEQEREGPGDS